jgi:hypothetical protein
MVPCLIKITLTTLWSEQLRTSDVEFAILCRGREVLLSMYNLQYTGLVFQGIRPASAFVQPGHPDICAKRWKNFQTPLLLVFRKPYLSSGNAYSAELLKTICEIYHRYLQ